MVTLLERARGHHDNARLLTKYLLKYSHKYNQPAKMADITCKSG